MSLRDILIHIGDADNEPERTAAVAELARIHQAHLTGLYVIDIPAVPVYVRSEIPKEVLLTQRRANMELAEEAKARFLEITDAAGIAAEWRCVEDNTDHALSVHSRYTDLVVVGRPGGPDSGAEERFIDRILLKVPKPVLVVPQGGTGIPMAQRILVAWNTSHEAVRAIDGAMPLLANAPEVDVVAVNPHSSATEHGPVPLTDICHHLARHNIAAKAHELKAEERDAGEVLLKWATDQRSDLIVMGAYGRWRISEIVLGGVTKHILRRARIPVLLAH